MFVAGESGDPQQIVIALRKEVHERIHRCLAIERP
jgi:hypothetical protein